MTGTAPIQVYPGFSGQDFTNALYSVGSGSAGASLWAGSAADYIPQSLMADAQGAANAAGWETV